MDEMLESTESFEELLERLYEEKKMRDAQSSANTSNSSEEL